VTVEVDVVLLGVGTSGEDLGLRLLDAGLEVAGIEPQLIGGECAYCSLSALLVTVLAPPSLGSLHGLDREGLEFRDEIA